MRLREFILLLTIVGALADSTTANTADWPIVLVMGADASAAAAPRDSPLFTTVQRAIENAIKAAGATVYDKTAVTLRTVDQTRRWRTDAELISTAQLAASVPIDVIAVHTLTATVEPGFAGIARLSLRLEGRLLDIVSGRTLGQEAVTVLPGEAPVVPEDCTPACIEAAAQPLAAELCEALGAALAERLAAQADPACEGLVQDVRLEVIGFGADQRATIEVRPRGSEAMRA